jgi:hypothetical protein
MDNQPKRGRPTKEEVYKRRHPSYRIRTLKAEIDEALEYLIGAEAEIYQIIKPDPEERRMCIQQVSTRIDELLVLLLNLKVMMARMHENPIRLM